MHPFKIQGRNQKFLQNESGSISRDDFEFVLSELGEIRNIKLIDDLFKEYDVDNDGYYLVIHRPPAYWL